MARMTRSEVVPEPSEEYTREEVWPLRDIWNNEPDINTHVNFRIFEAWAHRYETNDFPLPTERVGRYNFYDPEPVLKWVKLWLKANKRLRNNNGLKIMQEQTNGTRQD